MNNRHSLQDVAGMIAKKTGRTKADSEQFLRALFSLLSQNLYNDKLVKIKGIGTFKLILADARESVNVNTGERFVIPEHYKFSYIPDKDLKELVNEPFSFFETTELTDEAVSEIEKSIETDAQTEDTPEEEAKVTDPEPAPVQETVADTPIPPQAPADAEPPVEKAETPETKEPIQEIKVNKKSNSTGLLLVLTLLIFGALAYLYFTGTFGPAEEKSSFSIESSDIKPTETIPDNHEEAVIEEPVQPVSEPPIPNEVIATETIIEGSRLTLLSLKHYQHKVFWVYIYEYNKGIINNPNHISIGTEIKIPNPKLYDIDANNPEFIKKAKELENKILSGF